MTVRMVAAALRSFADGTSDGIVRVPADYLRRLAGHLERADSDIPLSTPKHVQKDDK